MRRRPFKDFDIGGDTLGKRLWSIGGYALFFLILGGAFAYLFFLLTMSWQIAIGSVTILIGYMVLMGWWAERNAGGTDTSMR